MGKDDHDEMQLRVSKAIPTDVGHGRARISGENDLGLKPGDIVEIRGKNPLLPLFIGVADQKMLILTSLELMES